MIDLKELAGKRYRVALDKSRSDEPSREERLWLYQIPCQRGHIGVWGENTLSAWTDRTPTSKRLEAIPGVKVVQRGDRELQVTFGPERLDAVAELLKARKKRQLTDEQREKLVARGKAALISLRTERELRSRIDSQDTACVLGRSESQASRGASPEAM